MFDAMSRTMKIFKDAFSNSLRTNPRKATYQTYEAEVYKQLSEYEDYYKSSWIIQRACDKMAEDALKNWIELKTDDDNVRSKINNEFKRLNFKQKLIECAQKMQIFGGAWILIGAKDGNSELSEPLSDIISEVTALTVMAKDDLTPVVWTEDILSPNYGFPEVWRESGSQRNIHHSRLIFMSPKTVSVDHRKERNGLGDSKIYIMSEAFKTWGIVNSSCEDICLDFATKIITVEGLIEKMTNDTDYKALMRRFTLMNQTLSTDALMVLGSEEKFEKISHNLSGFKDIIIFAIDCISGAARIPKTKLFGQQLGVLAGATETANDYYLDCESFREMYFQQGIDRLIQILSKVHNFDAEKVSWTFSPIQTPTEQEQVTMQKTVAETVEKLLTYNTISDEEARTVFSQNSDSWIINVDPKKKVEKQEQVVKNEG